MAIATQVMKNAANSFDAAISSAVCSGIVGDSSHNYGYHRAANEVPADDYSRQLPGDKDGIDWNAADAIDESMNPADMKTVTMRFYISWKDPNDYRLNYQREVIGTLDGVNVIYMDTQSGEQGTSDNSHLWHLHTGGLRKYTGVRQAWIAWVSVASGESWSTYKARYPDCEMVRLSNGQHPLPVPPPPPPPRPTAPPWPMNTRNEYFGDIDGPNESHGGANEWEWPHIVKIQKMLIRKGYARTYNGLRVTNENGGWADGKFQQPTIDAVARWQRAEVPGTTYFGQVWWDDWAKLLG